MAKNNDKINSFHLIALIVASMSGSAILLYPGRTTGNDAWLIMLLGFVLSLVWALIVIKLVKRYPGLALAEINESVWGPYFGKFISVLYIWYFFHLATIVVRDFSGLFSTIMPLTPVAVFVFVNIGLAAYMVRSGMEVISRCATLIIILAVLFLGLASLLLINRMDFSAFLPLFDISSRDLFKYSFAAATFPFGEIIVFVIFATALDDHNKAGYSLFMGMFWGMVHLLVLILIIIAVLGNASSITTYPTYTIFQRVDIAEIITRIDILGLSAALTLGITKMAVMFYAAVISTSQTLNISSYKPLVLPFGLLMLSVSMVEFPSSIVNFAFHENTYSYYAFFFQFILPLLTLMMAAIRDPQAKPKPAVSGSE